MFFLVVDKLLNQSLGSYPGFFFNFFNTNNFFSSLFYISIEVFV